MAGAILRHFRTHSVGYLALLVALSGTAYAAGQGAINGKQIRKNSIPGNRVKAKTLPGNRVKPNSLNGYRLKAGTVAGNRLRFDTITGEQVDESSLGTVPQASNATRAGDADALGGRGRSDFGIGVVNGAIENPFSGEAKVPPFGIFDTQVDTVVPAIAPVEIVLRDFVVTGFSLSEAGESVELTLEILDSNGARNVPLCKVTEANRVCEVAGPIAIADGGLYQLAATGVGLPAPSGVVGFQYRVAAG